MHASYMGLTVAAVYGVASRWGRGRGVIAALLAAAPPWMPMLGAIAYNEGGFLLYGTLAIGWAFSPSPGTPGEGGVRVLPRAESTSPDQENPHPTLSRNTGRGTMPYVLSGVMAGLAAGCKLTAVPMLLVGIPVAVLVANWRQWKGVAVFVVAGLLTFSPWLIRNAVWTGNPVFPEMQSVLGRGHFSEEQSARWHRAHRPRPDQQAMSVRVKELGPQVFGDSRFAYGVLPLGIVALLLTIRQGEARLLLVLLLILTAFWLLQTHLQGRFYVLAIPIAAIGLALAADGKRLILAGPLALVIMMIGFGITHDRLWGLQVEMKKRSNVELMATIGFVEIDRTPELYRARRQPPPSVPMSLVLMGDAQAFLYQIPMSHLYYRTVFDLDTSDSMGIREAFLAGVPKDQDRFVWVTLGELWRYERTYGLPPPDIKSSSGIGDMSTGFVIPAGR
jgi:hypothetical protein